MLFQAVYWSNVGQTVSAGLFLPFSTHFHLHPPGHFHLTSIPIKNQARMMPQIVGSYLRAFSVRCNTIQYNVRCKRHSKVIIQKYVRSWWIQDDLGDSINF